MTLRDYLKKHNISVAEFATTLGVAYENVFRWCDGSRKPRLKTMLKIVEITRGEVTIESFLGESPKRRAA